MRRLGPRRRGVSALGARAWIRISALALAALAALAAPACSPYDPSLPRAPFLCGDQEPRCPDGYVCVDDPDGRKVCRAADATDAGVPDASHAEPGVLPGAM